MNRREFLQYCAATGAFFGLSNLLSCASGDTVYSSSDRALLAALAIADPHAHPYQLHGSKKSDAGTPTVGLMHQAGMAVCSFAAVGDMVKYPGRSGSPYKDTLDQLNLAYWLLDREQVRPILGASDVPSGKHDGPKALLAVEGGDALEGKLGNLERFYQRGVRMLTLMHDHDNEIGCNQRSPEDCELTPFGARVVERMNELGMLVDVAHAKSRTLKGIAGVSRLPIIDSHTNLLPDGVTPTEPVRMRTWQEMELIAETGGIVCTWPLAYSKSYQRRLTLRDWAEEILLMKTRPGIEHCGLGTDSGGGLPQKVAGWRSYASLPALIRAMQEVGLSQEDIAAYFGGNFLRLLRRCLT